MQGFLHKKPPLFRQKSSKQGWCSYGAVGEIRTLVPLLTTTRFPIVLVMTTSIPLHISMLNSKNYYNRNYVEVKPLFEKKQFIRKGSGTPFMHRFLVFTSSAPMPQALCSSRARPSPAPVPPAAEETVPRGCCCPSDQLHTGRLRPRLS